ncbi:MAG: hydrogenase expression/formation protein HypE [Elusimicrobiota bacterium]|jgi:hydrogenase expression/formation protein HypE|nr:hydrogenase expression/formation protein HypE [Elusimicrobiota bacterium]
MDTIKIAHGSGGRESAGLIQNIILKYFGNPLLNRLEDAALLGGTPKNIALTCDGFVADPVFFPGGNIGDLAVCGAVNDLAVRGASPKYLSVSFILEDGLPVADFKKILAAMARRCKEAGVIVACGDTKVVQRGKCDKIFIITSAVGHMLPRANIAPQNIEAGDTLIISGALGEHSLAMLNARHNLGLKSNLKTDSAPLNKITAALINTLGPDVKMMRDITRGGLSSVLNELTSRQTGFEIEETLLPVSSAAKAASELLGLDILDMANEGKFVLAVSAGKAKDALKIIKAQPYGKGAAVVGQAVKGGKVNLITKLGVKRVLRAPLGEALPRIC